MTEKKPRLFSTYRDHYAATKTAHRPMPALYPLLAIVVLVTIAFVFLDPLAGAMYGRWPSWLANPAAHVTDIGRSGWILIVTTFVIVGGWLLRRLSQSERIGKIIATTTSIAFYLLASVGLAALIVNILKRAIGRPRPVEFADYGLFSIHPFTWNFDFESFPSGHSTVSGALFMALALVFPGLRWPLLILGFCLALTRVFVGAHFPSDVTAGFGFGLWFAFITALFFGRIGVLFDTNGGRLIPKT